MNEARNTKNTGALLSTLGLGVALGAAGLYYAKNRDQVNKKVLDAKDQIQKKTGNLVTKIKDSLMKTQNTIDDKVDSMADQADFETDKLIDTINEEKPKALDKAKNFMSRKTPTPNAAVI